MEAMNSEKHLRNICENVSKNLVLLPTENDTKDNNNNLTTRLIFPYGNDNKVRVSEQESRVLFCQEIERYHEELYYTIETPTEFKYSFADNKIEVDKDKINGQSALSDLSLFYRTNNSDNRIFKKFVNIELKAHNVEDSQIMKDLLKLVAEPVHGLLFHTLDNVDRGTLTNGGNQKGIFDKYKGIEKYVENFEKTDCGEKKFILFAVCIIKKKVLLMKTLRESDLNSKESFFKIEYGKICGDNPPELNDGWTQNHILSK